MMVHQMRLAEATHRLVAQFQPERITLFGSQTRGTADARSDIDLLVVCPFEGNRRPLMAAMDRALRGLPIATDIVVLTPEEFAVSAGVPGTVARPAARERRVLYERSRP
jgi:predicted nucleotidyltransferase